jgi:hypothetical protein
VLDQPADRPQASQRPPRADHVEVDVGAVAGDDVAQVVPVSERQAGEVVQGIALARLGPVEHAGDLVAVDEHVGDETGSAFTVTTNGNHTQARTGNGPAVAARSAVSVIRETRSSRQL